MPGATDWITEDNQVGDFSPLPGVIVWVGSLNSITVSAVVQSKPGIGGNGFSIIDLNFTVTGAGTVTLALTDNGFTDNGNGDAISQIGGTAAGSVRAWAYHDAGNVEFSQGTVIASHGPFGPGAFSGSGSRTGLSTKPFSLTSVVQVIHAVGTTNTTSGDHMIRMPESAFNTGPGTNVTVEPAATLPDGTETTVSLTFDSVEAPGTTSVSTSFTGPPPANGFKLGTPPVYHEIATTATFTGNVRVCLKWTEGQFANESNIRLFHRETPNWVDITNPASLDTVNNTVCGLTTSLSPFSLMEVKYPFAGFFQPVDNPPVVNSVKAGAAVPVKFSLGGDLGIGIFGAGYPRSQIVQCETGAMLDAIEATVTAGGSTLSYDAATGEYTYVWKTDPAWAGSCRELQVKLNDGEIYTAKFSMRR